MKTNPSLDNQASENKSGHIIDSSGVQLQFHGCSSESHVRFAVKCWISFNATEPMEFAVDLDAIAAEQVESKPEVMLRILFESIKRS
jgi:hypothetical protein